MKNYTLIESMSTTELTNSWDITCMKSEETGRDKSIEAMCYWMDSDCTDLTIKSNPLKCPVDMDCTCLKDGQKIEWCVEVKEYTHPQYDPEKTCYTICLKDWKIKKMKEHSKERPLYFFAIMYGYVYCWNLGKMNWDNITLENRYQKVVQTDPNSEWRYYPTWNIPISTAHRIYKIGGQNNGN